MPGSGDAQASCQRAKGRPEDDKLPEETKRRGDTGTGEEEARRRRTGDQELEARLPSGPAGTGPQVEAGRGEEWFKEWWKNDRT